MTSTSQKGQRAELKAINLLEAQGYVIHRTLRASIRRQGRWFSLHNDVFGCIDILAKKRGERMRYIQVTSTGGIGKKARDLAQVPWDPHLESIEIWRWVSGAGKRLDGRTGLPRDRLYFQVYRLDRGFVLDKSDRIKAESN